MPNLKFLMAPNRDIVILEKRTNASNKTDLYLLPASRGYREITHHTVTAFKEVPEYYDFTMASNGDIFFIKKDKTGTNSTELHVLSAVSNYKKFVLHTGTALEETDSRFEFEMNGNRDMYVIKKDRTGSNKTELHVLSASSGYKGFSKNVATILGETNSRYSFLLAPNKDLFAIKRSSTGTNSTEVHVMSASSNYSQFSLQIGTALPETNHEFEFLMAPNRDIVAIERQHSGGTELRKIYVLSAKHNYKQFSHAIDAPSLRVRKGERTFAQSFTTFFEDAYKAVESLGIEAVNEVDKFAEQNLSTNIVLEHLANEVIKKHGNEIKKVANLLKNTNTGKTGQAMREAKRKVNESDSAESAVPEFSAITEDKQIEEAQRTAKKITGINSMSIEVSREVGLFVGGTSSKGIAFALKEGGGDPVLITNAELDFGAQAGMTYAVTFGFYTSPTHQLDGRGYKFSLSGTFVVGLDIAIYFNKSWRFEGFSIGLGVGKGAEIGSGGFTWTTTDPKIFFQTVLI